MAQSKVVAISKRAKKIRKPGEPWLSAIKRASKQISGTVKKPGKRSKAPGPRKSVPRKKAAKKGYKPRKPVHQTGTSSRKIDKRIKAKTPGKRKGYYEYRKNRSDMPGRLTGTSSGQSTYRYNVMQRISSNVRLLGEAEKRLFALQQLLKACPRDEKPRVRLYIKDQRKYVLQLKKDISGFKSLLR